MRSGQRLRPSVPVQDWLTPKGEVQPVNHVVISSTSPESLGNEGGLGLATFTTASTAWPAANRAIFVPFVILAPLVVVKMSIINRGAVSGNLDLGIYDIAGVRLVSSGSTPHAGTNVVQTVDIADTPLPVGEFYAALAFDNNTALFEGSASVVAQCSAAGVLSQSTAFPLPNPATFAAAVDAWIPMIQITGRTLI